MGTSRALRHLWIFAILLTLTGCRSSLLWQAFNGNAIGSLSLTVPGNNFLKDQCIGPIQMDRAMYAGGVALPEATYHLDANKGGYYYSAPGCGSGWFENLTFAEGETSKQIYFQPWGSWNYVLYASNASWTTGVGSFNVRSTNVDGAQSYITIDSSTVVAGGYATVTVYAKDAAGNPVLGYEVPNNMRFRTVQPLYALGYSRLQFETFTDYYDGHFSMQVLGLAAGAANEIEVVIGGSAVIGNRVSLTVLPDTFSPSRSIVHIDQERVPFGGSAVVTLFARDSRNNPVAIPGFTCTEASISTGLSRATFDASSTDQGAGVYTLNIYGNTQGTPNQVVCQVPGYGTVSSQPPFIVSRVGIASAPPQTTWWSTTNGTFQIGLSIQGALTGGDTIVCRMKKPADSAVFTPCDGSTGLGTTFTKSVPGAGQTDGFFDFEVGFLPFGNSEPVGVIKRRFYLHSNLSGRVHCAGGPSDQQYFDRAKQILGLPSSILEPYASNIGPIITTTRTRGNWVQDSNIRTLRKRYAFSGDRSYYLVRRTFQGDNTGCAMTFRTQGSGINLNGSYGRMIKSYSCDAMVVDADGRSVCLTSGLGLVKAFSSYRLGNQSRNGSVFLNAHKVKATQTEFDLSNLPRMWTSGIILSDF